MVAAGLIMVSVIFVFTGREAPVEERINLVFGRTTPIRLPNILMIASDGLNAEHMSAYGYHRDTTPFISERRNERWFFRISCGRFFPHLKTGVRRH